MTQGFDTPERAAMGDIPARFCRVLGSEMRGDHAYVLLDTGSPTNAYPYGVHCYRENGRWHEGSGSNGCGWSSTDDTGLGCFTVWGEAPEDCDAVRVAARGADHVVAVRNGYYLLALWDWPDDDDDWPEVRAHRIAGSWRERPWAEVPNERVTKRALRRIENE